MASILCSYCGEGIHYHDDPDGTQYICFPMDIWNKLIASDIWVSRYTLDGTDEYYLVWKCNKCGSNHIFKGDCSLLTQAYHPIETSDKLTPGSDNYIIFSDIEWALLTENRIKGNEISKIVHNPRIISCCLENNQLFVTDHSTKNTTIYACLE